MSEPADREPAVASTPRQFVTMESPRLAVRAGTLRDGAARRCPTTGANGRSRPWQWSAATAG